MCADGDVFISSLAQVCDANNYGVSLIVLALPNEYEKQGGCVRVCALLTSHLCSYVNGHVFV